MRSLGSAFMTLKSYKTRVFSPIAPTLRDLLYSNFVLLDNVWNATFAHVGSQMDTLLTLMFVFEFALLIFSCCYSSTYYHRCCSPPSSYCYYYLLFVICFYWFLLLLFSYCYCCYCYYYYVYFYISFHCSSWFSLLIFFMWLFFSLLCLFFAILLFLFISVWSFIITLLLLCSSYLFSSPSLSYFSK